MVERVALYPGTFDPITNGHLDIITRASRMVDRLIVAVAVNVGKGPLFTLEERVAMVRGELDSLPISSETVLEVMPFENLLVHFARDNKASIIVRGLRAVSDFDYEFQMAGMNDRIAPDIETIFLMASEGCLYISSRFVKEIGRLGGDISPFVSARVLAELRQRF